MVRSFRDLLVWQRAMALARESYVVARCLPVEERFALANQLRRAATAVPSNIAEGHLSPHRPEFLRYLRIAHASLMELECQLLLCVEVGHLHAGQIASALTLADETGRMLRAMRRALGEQYPRRPSPVARRSDEAPPQHIARRNRSQS